MRRSIILFLLPIAIPAFGGEDPRAAVESRCALLGSRVEALLGPKFEHPVPVRIVSRDFIAEYAREAERKLTPAAGLGAAQDLAVRLRQVPEGYDLAAREIELIQQEFVGLYDPGEHRFFVVEHAGDPASQLFTVTAAHELVHAYRDVDKDYYRRIVAAVATDVDWAVAITCLAEGDATMVGQAVGNAVLLGRKAEKLLPAVARGAPDAARNMERLVDTKPELQDFPFALRELLLGRYAAGLAFAGRVFEKGGVAALDAAYDAPPRSTEQILHPERYLGPEVDEPTVFTGGDPTAALGDGWRLALTNVMGEFEIRIHFGEMLGRERAARVAAGWDGARYHYCTRDGAPSFVGIVSTWDRELDAVEFADAWAEWASRRDGTTEEVAVRGGERRVATREGAVVVRRRDRDVLVADGVPPDRVEAVMEALAAASRRDRRADERPPE